MNDLQEELSRTRVEDEDGPVDGLGRQVTFKCLHTNKSILNEPSFFLLLLVYITKSILNKPSFILLLLYYKGG